MNREIKFRVFDSISKQMHLNGIVKHHPLSDFDLEHYSIMQYTGLKDKNGKEIYECDIIQVNGETTIYYNEDIFEEPENVDFELTAKVYYNDSIGGFDLMTIEADLNMNCWSFYGEDTNNHLEVIGNIHQNPELINI